MPRLTIDGQQVEVEEGATILDAANQLGIEIATLCHHPMLKPYGACRVCVVEMDWQDQTRIVASCNYPARDGAVIQTSSERALASRRMAVEFLLGRGFLILLLVCANRRLVFERSAFYLGYFVPAELYLAVLRLEHHEVFRQRMLRARAVQRVRHLPLLASINGRPRPTFVFPLQATGSEACST